MSDKWQPIETAPKDGTLAIFSVNGFPVFSRSDDYWANAYWLAKATHWMLLPEPPK